MDYGSVLKTHELKVTPQRLLLLDQIHAMGHIDIDTLFSYVKKRFPNISLATLYKNINAMVEKSILKEVKIAGMKTKYELTKDAHAHTICQSCGKVQDVHLDVNTLVDTLENQTHYTIQSSDMNFFGLCPDCK